MKNVFYANNIIYSGEKPLTATTQPRTALCYIRLSVTKDMDPSNSPEIQKKNLLAACEEKGFTPEFHEDVQGHKSGTATANRPGWLALERRLADDDVVALVANDLSRLHRRGWKVGQLLEHLDKHNVDLIITAPGREVDTSTPMGKLFIQFTSLFDEYYARDIAIRTKATIKNRKDRGITHARPPFGTIRERNGYLKPSPYGVWLLPNGTFVEGTDQEQPAHNAIWKGYYDAVERIMTLYTTGNLGYMALAHKINDEGYAFLTRSGPGQFDSNAIKRIIRAWPEYGGTTMDITPKKRSATTLAGINIDDFLSEDRAVFEIRLIRAVAETFLARKARDTGTGKKDRAHTYALQELLVCHHCADKAARNNDPSLRTTLVSRKRANGIRYYQHKPNIDCGCKPKSVPCESLETEFGALLTRLRVRPEVRDTLLSNSSPESPAHDLSDTEFVQERSQAIALAERRFKNSQRMYRDGDLSDAEYDADKARYEATLAEWEEKSRAVRQVKSSPEEFLPILDNLSRLWEFAGNEQRYKLTRFFEEVVVNLNTGKIESYRLKDWVEGLLFEQVKNPETPSTEA